MRYNTHTLCTHALYTIALSFSFSLSFSFDFFLSLSLSLSLSVHTHHTHSTHSAKRLLGPTVKHPSLIFQFYSLRKDINSMEYIGRVRYPLPNRRRSWVETLTSGNCLRNGAALALLTKGNWFRESECAKERCVKSYQPMSDFYRLRSFTTDVEGHILAEAAGPTTHGDVCTSRGGTLQLFKNYLPYFTST